MWVCSSIRREPPFSAFRWGRHSADEVRAATIDGLSMLGSVELSLRCQGESTPTVIFMPGGGAALPTSPLPPWMPSLRTGSACRTDAGKARRGHSRTGKPGWMLPAGNIS